MAEKRWKRHERAVAKDLGARRNRVPGVRAADVTSEWLCVEVKSRRTIPVWLVHGLLQAEISARTNQLPLLVVVPVDAKYKLVVMSMANFRHWFIPTKEAWDER